MVVENEEAKQRYTDAANEIIKRFGLAGYVPEPPKSVTAEQNEPAPKPESKSIITRRGSSLKKDCTFVQCYEYRIANKTSL